ncbi:MAG TPA: AraC family transcriptional regulator [Clostridiales bacterium]|nr:AraC family transcriptional regulator [Clostridiales bacterium]
MKALHQKTLLDADFPMNIFFTDVTEFPPHWHEVVELVYITEGSLTIGVNNEVYTMEPGDIVLVSGSDVHYFVPIPNQVNRLIVHFDMAYFESAYPEAKNKRFAIVHMKKGQISDNGVDVHELLVEQLDEIISEYKEQRPAYKLVLRARLFDVLSILIRNVPMQPYSPQERSRQQKRLGRLENVFRYVEENYSSPISLEEIASVANFSEYYFTRFFKEATGMTFGRYLNNYRVEKAAQFLRNGDDSITEVVFKSGFGSIKTFNRVFKQIKGCSPSAYKKDNF